MGSNGRDDQVSQKIGVHMDGAGMECREKVSSEEGPLG